MIDNSIRNDQKIYLIETNIEIYIKNNLNKISPKLKIDVINLSNLNTSIPKLINKIKTDKYKQISKELF